MKSGTKPNHRFTCISARARAYLPWRPEVFLLAVADDAAALAAVLDYGPEKADLGMCKVSVLLVVERRRRIEEGAFIHSGISSAEMKARELTFSKSEIGGCGLKAPAPQSGSSSFLSW